MQKHINELVRRYPDLVECVPAIAAAYEVLKKAYQQGGKLLICGNGGSAADAEHIVGELMKGFMLPRKLPSSIREQLIAEYAETGDYLANHLQQALPSISLVSQSALISAFANDIAPDMIYAQQVYGYGRAGDVLLAISTSGNSENIVHALQVARVIGLATISLTGRTGGKLRELCDINICVPSDSTPSIQERHLPIYHILCIMLEEEFFGG